MIFLYYAGNEDEIEEMDDERLHSDETESTGHEGNDDAAKSGGKEKYIHKLCNPKKDRYY